MNTFKMAGVIAMIVALTGLTALALPTLQNGTFSEGTDGLEYWTVEPEYSVFVYDGEAIFNENSSVPPGTLSQAFTIPDILPEFAQRLSFKIQISLLDGTNETDVFTASLRNPNTMESLTGSLNFFYWESSTGELDITTITLDIPSSLYGVDALLSFNLLADEEDPITIVYLDDVKISVVPAPGALVLGLIGTGAVGLWRRFSRGV